MTERILSIVNKLGLHARAAAKFVATASEFKSDIKVARQDRPEQQVNGKSIMGMMMLAAAKGSDIIVSAEGNDELDALNQIENLINNYFGEGE